MTPDLDFKMFWMIGSALFGAGGAFAAVKLTISQVKKIVDENKENIAKRGTEIGIHNVAISVIDVKLTNILEIVKEGQKTRECAQKEHLARFRSLEEKLIRIDQKIMNDAQKPVSYSVEKV